MKFIVFLAAIGVAAALPQWYSSPYAYSAFQPSYYYPISRYNYPIQHFGNYDATTSQQPNRAIPVIANTADPSVSDSFSSRGEPSAFDVQGGDYGVYDPQSEFIYINFKKKKILIGK